MQEATGELTRFKRDTERPTATISGKRGLGGIGGEFKRVGSSVSNLSLSQNRAPKGLRVLLRPTPAAMAGGGKTPLAERLRTT